jgi:hypothetical protein
MRRVYQPGTQKPGACVQYSSGSRQKKTAQSLFECRQVVGLAFPHDMRTPSECGQRLLYLAVARDIAVKFGLPEFNAALGCVGETAAMVAMPEAAMNQNGGPSAREDNVGSAGKIAPVKSESNAEPVQDTPDGNLGSGILLPDPRHHGASFRRNRLVLAQLGLAIGRKNG